MTVEVKVPGREERDIGVLAARPACSAGHGHIEADGSVNDFAASSDIGLSKVDSTLIDGRSILDDADESIASPEADCDPDPVSSNVLV